MVVAGILVLGLVLTATVVGVAQIVIAGSRVMTAAEAGALAAAPVTFRPFGAAGSATSEAASLVEGNGAEMVSCSCPPDPRYGPRTAIVTARVTVAILGLRRFTLEATAGAEFRPTALLHPDPIQSPSIQV